MENGVLASLSLLSGPLKPTVVVVVTIPSEAQIDLKLFLLDWTMCKKFTRNLLKCEYEHYTRHKIILDRLTYP